MLWRSSWTIVRRRRSQRQRSAEIGSSATLTLGTTTSAVTVGTANVTGTLVLEGRTNTITGDLTGGGTLDVNAETTIEKGGTIGTLDVATGKALTLGKADNTDGAVTLTVSKLLGDGSITTGVGSTNKTLKLERGDETGDSFDGAIGVDFEYAKAEDATEDAYTLNGAFTGSKLTVKSGSLTLVKTGMEETSAVIDLSGKTLSVRGSLTLGGGSTSKVTVGALDGDSLESGGHLTLSGASENTVSGAVTLDSNESLTFATEGKADGGATNKVGGLVTLTSGTLAWTGELSVGGLSGSGTLTVTGGADGAESLIITGGTGNYTGTLGSGLSVTMKAQAADVQIFAGNSHTNAFTVKQGTLQFTEATSLGAVTVDGGTLDLDATTGTTLTSLSGTGGKVDAAGKLTLSGTSEYAGQLAVKGLTLNNKLTYSNTGATNTVEALEFGASGSLELKDGGKMTAKDLKGDSGSITGTGELTLNDSLGTGSFGGSIESSFVYNGSTYDVSTFGFTLSGNGAIGGELTVQGGKLTVSKDTELGVVKVEGGELVLSAAATVGAVTLSNTGKLTLGTSATLASLSGQTATGANVVVTGYSLTLSGASTFGGTITAGSLTVGENSTLANVELSGNLTVNGSKTLTLTGALTADKLDASQTGGITGSTGTLTFAGVTGGSGSNTYTGAISVGTLEYTGNAAATLSNFSGTKVTVNSGDADAGP